MTWTPAVDPLSLAAAAREVPDEVALVSADEATTYATLARRAHRIAIGLLAHAGAPPPSATGPASEHPPLIALRATNRSATVAAILGLIDRGVALVPIHPRATADEAAAIAASARASALVGEAEIDAAEEAGAGADRVRADAPRSHGLVHASSTLGILFTSGTTGRAKGAVLSRGAFVASARASAANLGWRADDRWLACMPIAHVGGLSVLTRVVAARRAVVLHERFDAGSLLASIDRDRATLASVVPTMLRALLEADGDNRLARLRAVLVGGAACPPVLLEECARRGVRALTTYGLTEACSQVTAQRLADPPRCHGAGAPVEHAEVTIAGGTIHVRGATLFDGYLGEDGVLVPRAPGAWFDTGDLGEFDARGDLHVLARRTDLVVSGGENVYPAEVEAALTSIPGVRGAVVFGIADERWGEVVGAAIEIVAGASVAAIGAEVKRRIASHKRPRRVCVVDAVPTCGPGKIDRAAARARFTSCARPWPE